MADNKSGSNKENAMDEQGSRANQNKRSNESKQANKNAQLNENAHKVSDSVSNSSSSAPSPSNASAATEHAAENKNTTSQNQANKDKKEQITTATNNQGSENKQATNKTTNSTHEKKESTMTTSSTNKNDQTSKASETKASEAKVSKSETSESKTLTNNDNSKSAQANGSAVSAPQSGSKMTFLFGLVLILVIACLAFFVYQSYVSNQALKQEIALLQQKSAFQMDPAQIEQAAVLAQSNQQQIAQIVGNQQAQAAQMQKMTQSFADIDRQHPNDWVLAEANYLVKLAARKLSLEKDVTGATQLLISADQRIAAMDNPALLEVRKALAEDIAKLRAVKGFDPDGVALRLLALQGQVATLPLNTRLLDEAELPKLEVSNDVSDWKENLGISLEQFMNSFIVVRTHNGDAPQLLSPEQHGYLQENIRTKLDLATKAVYTQNDQLYQASLEAIQKWSGQYFQQSANSVKAFNKEIAQLQAQKVTFNLPKELSALQPLNHWVSKRLPQYAIGEGE